MLRVPVLTSSGKLLMPTKASRARRWLKEGKAKVVHNGVLTRFAKQKNKVLYYEKNNYVK